MKICVYGAGAVGGLMAAWLARAGYEVSVVARGPQLEAIRRHGLRVRSANELKAWPVRAESDPAVLGAQDYVLVTVKGQSHIARWEVRQNAVWRRGRVFLRCPRCERRC